jgi:hypothetical protein
MSSAPEHVEVLYTVVDRPFRLRDETARITRDWQEWLVRELRGNAFDVTVDAGMVRVSRRGNDLGILGLRRCVDVEGELAEREWLDERSPVPWVGEVLGYVAYAEAPRDRAPASRDEHESLALWLGHLAVGPVFDFVTEDVHQPLVEKTFSLLDTTMDYGGFRDAMISFDQEYMDMMAAKINDRLRAIGISTTVVAVDREYASWSSATPFSFLDNEAPGGPVIVDLEGKRIGKPDPILKKERIGFWVHDHTFYERIKSLGFFAGPMFPP